MLSVKGVSYTGICHISLYKLYWTTNPEVLFDVRGIKQHKNDQSSLSSCSQVHQSGWLRSANFLV